MCKFQPVVKVERKGSKNDLFSYSIDGTAQVHIVDLCGYVFINDDVKNQFIMEVENYKSSLKNAPDNFNDEDREIIKSFVEELLYSYFRDGKLVKR
jgi:hypothetical protein